MRHSWPTKIPSSEVLNCVHVLLVGTLWVMVSVRKNNVIDNICKHGWSTCIEIRVLHIWHLGVLPRHHPAHQWLKVSCHRTHHFYCKLEKSIVPQNELTMLWLSLFGHCIDYDTFGVTNNRHIHRMWEVTQVTHACCLQGDNTHAHSQALLELLGNQQPH